MYRLLIVTNNPKAEETFTHIEGWEAMGYKPPRLRTTAEDAIACMQKHYIHAIAVDHDAAFAPLMQHLNECHPTIPLFQIADTQQEQLTILKDVYRLLSQIHADDTNDDYNEAYAFKTAQERWMKRLISGLMSSPQQVEAFHNMLRFREPLNGKCLYARLSIPAGDDFLLDRWHYGSDRLEMALHNFFGGERANSNIYVAVISPEEVRILICPKSDAVGEMSAECALSFIEETIEQIENYMGLHMSLVDIKQINGLTAFAADLQN